MSSTSRHGLLMRDSSSFSSILVRPAASGRLPVQGLHSIQLTSSRRANWNSTASSCARATWSITSGAADSTLFAGFVRPAAALDAPKPTGSSGPTYSLGLLRRRSTGCSIV
jgi:hypothetical protein